MIVRCTKRLLDVLRLAPGELSDPAPDDEDWYANLVWLAGRKCLLITHAATLFTAVRADVTAAELRSTHRVVTGLIGRELHNESLPPDTFGDLSREPLHIAKTANRSVLGCMNDMTLLCQYVVADAGGLPHTDMPALNRSLRRNINSARGYQPPIDLVTARLASPNQ